MPAFIHLQKYQKGKLVCSLFPEETRMFVQFLLWCADAIHNDPAEFRKQLNPPSTIDIPEWEYAAKEIKQAITEHEDKLHRNSILFGYEMFDYGRGGFSAYCLLEYSKRLKLESKFRQLVIVLFD